MKLFNRCGRSVLAIVLLFFASVSQSRQIVSSAAKDGITILSPGPWNSVATTSARTSRPKVIYGQDDRHDVYQESEPLRLQQAASTCGLLNTGNLVDNGNGTYTIQTFGYSVGGTPPCAGEPFAGQPVAMFCTGFMVGNDLIATAGHCYDDGKFDSVRFVFGFQMADPNTPVTVVSADRVYSGVEVVGREHTDELDYCIVRVDRRITSPGAVPLEIRRTGTVPLDSNVGVMGYPSGLPLKISFGATTRVDKNTDTGFVVANLDTYAGNSGSPVFNATTGQVEGILVRGQDDFVINGTCFNSNVLPDHPGGEEVSKSATFEHFVPGITFEHPSYNLQRWGFDFHIVDPSVSSLGVNVGVHTTVDGEVGFAGGDGNGVFYGTIPIRNGTTALIGDAVLELSCGDQVVLTYDSATNGGTAGTFTTTATVDCTPPSVSQQVVDVQSDSISIAVTTDKPTSVSVQIGTECGSGKIVAPTEAGSSFTVQANGLEPCTAYFYRINAIDEAGNVTTLDNGGDCFSTLTLGESVAYAEYFESGAGNWTHAAAIGEDKWQPRNSPDAVSGSSVFSYLPGSDSAADAALVSPGLPSGKYLTFLHSFAFEAPGYDGGVIELSTDGGFNWQDLGTRIARGGYTGVLNSSYGNPLGGRDAWTGGSLEPMSKVIIDYSGIPANSRVRFRFGSDSGTASGGWEIDNFKISNTFPCELPVCPGADLTGDWEPRLRLKHHKAHGETRWNIIASFRAENTGEQASRHSQLGVYLRDPQTSGELFCKAVRVGGLRPHHGERLHFTIRLPGGVDPRGSYLVGRVDLGNRVRECDESNVGTIRIDDF